MQGTFAENWVESDGRVIVGEEYFPFPDRPGEIPAMIVASPASASSSSRSRMLTQVLVASALKTIYLSTPYFLPDADLRRELKEAKHRGVDIKIITPGKHNDHVLTRSSSRRLYGELLQEGIEIYEYQPGMIHQKLLIVDGTWVVLGSTNMDNRSFHLNDEVNIAAYDGSLSKEVTALYLNDLKESHRMTYDEWKKRPLWDKLFEWTGKLIERQQ
jgi:cardiolipin synthase